MKLFDEIRGTVKGVVETAKNVKAVWDGYRDMTEDQLEELVRTAPRRENNQVTKEWR